MVQRAVDQGNPKAQWMLGKLLSHRQHDNNGTTEANRLFALSAYQGDINGMLRLEQLYSKQYKS